MNIAARGRGRLALVALAALAVVIVAAFLAGRNDPDVSLTVAGPPPSSEGAGAGRVPPVAPPVPEEPATTTTTPDQLSVEAVQERPSPQPATSLPPADDPVVRFPTSVPSGSVGSPVAPPPPAGPPPTIVPPAAACPASAVGVSVVTAPTYALGETVRGSATIENRSATTCSLPTRAFVHIQNAAGKDVSRFAYTMELRFPVTAEPGKTFTTPFTWDQRDCTGAACVQVPAGTYTVVANWTEGGSYTAETWFQISA